MVCKFFDNYKQKKKKKKNCESWYSIVKATEFLFSNFTGESSKLTFLVYEFGAIVGNLTSVNFLLFFFFFFFVIVLDSY